MTNETILATISTAVAKYDMTARMTGDLVSVYNKKGRLAGTVTPEGIVDRKFDGKQALMGALVRDSITAALKWVC
jgi:hypothetical protein